MVDENIKKLLDEADDHMSKTLEHLRAELNAIRAGRANVAMLENVRVEYYGSTMPLNQVAGINAPQPDLLVIQPWDRGAIGPIEKALRASNMGMNPSNDGTVIRIPIPPPTEERRKELAKNARHRGEEARVAVRNVRREVKDHIKAVQNEKKLSEDIRFEGEERLQKLTDGYIEKIDRMLEKKEAEIMEV